MVLYDDKKWLCRLINKAFTIEDDSGVCEQVLKRSKPYVDDIVGGLDDSEESSTSNESFDIREVSDGHRKRSNTAIRLERLEKQRKAARTDTQNIRIHPGENFKNEIVFVKDENYKDKNKSNNKKIPSIKKLLHSVPHPDQVPYSEYARFESSCHPTAPCKKMSIFLPFLPGTKKLYPLRIGILSNAKVTDLIGLSLWLGAKANPDIKFKQVENYDIQIADEDGEWDNEFPPLDRKEPVSKFSFSYLALVELEDSTKISKYPYTFIFLLPNGSTFKMNLEEAEINIGQLINLVLTKSDWSSNVLFSSSAKNQLQNYHLEKKGDPNVKFLDNNLPMSQCKCKEFCLVRNGSKSIQEANRQDPLTGKNLATMPTGKSDLYPVTVSTGRFNKVKSALCVIWGGDRMDLEFQNKTKSYPLSSITSIKFDPNKNKVIVTISQVLTTSVVTTLTMSTNELRIATDLYQHLNSIFHLK